MKRRLYKTGVIFHTTNGVFREEFQSRGTPKEHITYVLNNIREVLKQFDELKIDLDIEREDFILFGGDLAKEIISCTRPKLERFIKALLEAYGI